MTIKKQLNESSYSAKAASAGKDIGKPGKNFAKIAKDAGKRYGSKAAGERVAGAVLNKLRKGKMNEADMEEGNEFSGELAKAKASHKKEFEVDGKTYPVKEGFFGDNVGKVGISDIPQLGIYSVRRSRFEKQIDADPQLAPHKEKMLKAMDRSYNLDRDFKKAKDAAMRVVQMNTVQEGKKAKPDFLDMDKDGDKKEPMKKALKDKAKTKTKVKESYDFSSLESMYTKALNEGISISTTQTSGSEGSSYGGGSTGPSNTINVSAQDEDAKALMDILRKAGLVDGDSDSTHDHHDDVVAAPGGELETSDDYEQEGGEDMSGTIEVIKPSDMSNSGSDVMKQLLAKMMGKDSQNESQCNECGSMYEGESCGCSSEMDESLGNTLSNIGPYDSRQHDTADNADGGVDSQYSGRDLAKDTTDVATNAVSGLFGTYNEETEQVEEADMVGDFMNQITYDTKASDDSEAIDGATVTADDSDEEDSEDNDSDNKDKDEFDRFLDLLRPIMGDDVDTKKDDLKDVFAKVDLNDEEFSDDTEAASKGAEEEENVDDDQGDTEEYYDEEEVETTSESKEEVCETCHKAPCECDDEEVDEGIEDMGQSVEDAAAEKEGEAEANAEKLSEMEYGAALQKVRESAGLPSQSIEGLANGADDTATQDTEFMVNTISQGANQKKSTQIAIQPQNKKWPVNETSNMMSMRSVLDKLTSLK